MQKRNKDKDQYIKFIATINVINKYSDENHPMTTKDIQDKLDEDGYDFQIDFRAVKKYVEFYNTAYKEDVILCTKEGRTLHFYNTNLYLDPIEAKVIVDLIFSSDFLTLKTKQNYKKRMQALFSIYYKDYFEKVLDLHVTKNENPQVFYEELELIAQAISQRKMIRFIYQKPAIGKKPKPKENELAPIDTIFTNNEYYLLCQGARNPKECILYRMDYVKNVEIIEDKTFHFTQRQLHAFNKTLKNMTYMFSQGNLEAIELTFKKEVYTNMIDKFGNSIRPKKIDDDTYKVNVRHIINSTFYSWIIGFQGMIQISGNDEQIHRFKEFLQTNFLDK